MFKKPALAFPSIDLALPSMVKFTWFKFMYVLSVSIYL